MPDIGYFHPQLVHFTIVLAALGVIARLLAFTGKMRWTEIAAPVLLISAALVTLLTAQSGDDAHGIPERIPGARDAVVAHEEWGERTRNILLIVGALELVAVALRKRKVSRVVHGLSAVGGLAALFAVYEAAEHGGELVYSYGAGVGTRSGDSLDVGRLLVAGLYHQAMADRQAGRRADAARLIDELARRQSGDPAVALLAIESRLEDLGDAAGARAALAQAPPPADNRRLTVQHGILLAKTYAALGFRDSALAEVSKLKAMAPNSTAVTELEQRIR